MRRSPGFTITAMLTLALAIGANAVVFGVLNRIVIRPLDVPDARSLYAFETAESQIGHQSYPDYIDFRARNHSFEDLAAFSISEAVLDPGANPSRIFAYETSGNYFDVLALQPFLGRFFHATDERGPNSAPYVVLTFAYWHSHFQDDRGPRSAGEPAPLHGNRRGSASLRRHAAVLFSRLLCADCQSKSD
jgi:hypothetical protein